MVCAYQRGFFNNRAGMSNTSVSFSHSGNFYYRGCLRTAFVCYIFYRGYITAMVFSVLFIMIGSTAISEPRL